MSQPVPSLLYQPTQLPSPDTPPDTPKCILLIDQTEDSGTVIKLSLEMMMGWQVLVATSLPQGRGLALEHLPDIILLDLETTGVSTPAQLYLNLPPIPVVLIVPRVRLGDRLKIEQQGIAAIVDKPFDPLTLAQCLINLLNQSASAPVPD
ncbi:two-component system response regulator [Almyronema epifaneia]|uniref:Two-component system response regulator n=1 Tax=Almyronema epifaneia S1 TaxID=2991925 RepID=A0ABW6IBI5_9CYAN